MIVSVIIPCYNVEYYIRECLVSVAEQTYRDIEVICVNDGSTDQTLEVINSERLSFPFPMKIINNANNGASHARNSGLKVASGQYLQFLDADDQLLRNKISHQIHLMQLASNDPVFLVGDYKKVYGKDKTRVVRSDHREPWFGLIGHRLGITSSNLWVKKYLDQIDGWDESLKSSQEYDLMFRLLKISENIVFDHELLTIIRRNNNNSISNSNIRDNRCRFIELRKGIFNYLKSNNKITNELENHYYQIIFKMLRSLFTHDRKEALFLSNKLLPHGFIPSNQSLNPKWYIFLYRIIGFRNTQIIWEKYSEFKMKLKRIYK